MTIRTILVAALAAAVCGCASEEARKEAPKAAFRLADAAVVWNPGTGLNKEGQALAKAALVDLTNAIAKVTGKVPAVYEEGKLPANLNSQLSTFNSQLPIIYLGDTKAARAAGCSDANLRRGDWQIKIVPNSAYIFAKAGMGTTYGMSDFVERYLGYYFLTPEGDDPYDFNPALEIPCADFTVKPAVYNARIYTGQNFYGTFARRRRAPSYPYGEIEGGERLSRQMRENHTSFSYLPPEKYFKAHPEWYSMVNGRRQYTPVGQICMSNPEARRECLKNLLAFAAKDRAQNPTDYPCLYDFTQQDNMSCLCECPECQKIIRKYTRGKDPKGRGDNYNGGDAGLQLEFINWIATEAKKVYPDIKIRTFAYVSTECPPKPGTIVPADNVRIWWCDLYGESEHHRPLTDGPFNFKRAEQIGEWMRIAKEVEIWDYMLYGGSYNGDYPEWSPDGIAADAKFFAKNHLSSMFMEKERMGGPNLGHSMLPQTFYELNFYLLSVFYTYPDADLDEHVRRYCRVYGKGAAKMYEALEFLRKITMANPAKTYSEWHQRQIGWRTAGNWEKFRALVKAAYDAERSGMRRARIARVLASVSVELARIYAQDPNGKAKCEAARKDYATSAFEYVRTLPIDEKWRARMLKELQTTIDLFNLKFKDLPEGIAGVPDDEIKCADYHRFSGACNAATVKDPDSETGMARVWHLGKDSRYHKGLPIPCWMYDDVLRNGQNYAITKEMAAKDEKYHWYRLGPGYVGSGAVFAMPGDWHMTFRFADWYIQKDGLAVDPNWYDVYLSLKLTGPAYVPGSTKPNGIWMDRLLLRRIAPPAAKGFRLADATVVYEDALMARGPKDAWGREAVMALTNALARVVGAPIRAYPESKAPAGLKAPVYLGATKAAAAAGLDTSALRCAEFRLKVEKDRAFLLGKTGMASSYAMTEFLKHAADYRFLTIDGDDPYVVQPDREVAPCDVTKAPAAYVLNNSFWSNGPTGFPATGDLRRRWFQRVRAFSFGGEIEPELMVSLQTDGKRCHTFWAYVPPAKYAKDHPEYYSMNEKGVRFVGNDDGSQLCLSNPDVYRIALASLVSFVEADRAKFGAKAPRIYDFSQNDNSQAFCHCPACRKTIAKYNRKPGGHEDGGDAGLLLEFVNRLARDIRAKYPGIQIRTFAYCSTVIPPVGLRPEPNVMIWLCDLYGFSCHDLPLTHPFNKSRLDILRDWAALTDNIDVWDYTLYNDRTLDVFPDAVASDAKTFRDLGFRRYYVENHYWHQPFWEFNTFLQAELFFDPDQPLEPLVDAWCRVYGKGAAEMRAGIDVLRRLMAENPPETPATWHARVIPWMTPENVEKVQAHFKAAYAAEPDPSRRWRIAAACATAAQMLAKAYKMRPAESARYAEAKADYIRFATEDLAHAPVAGKDLARCRRDLENWAAMIDLEFKRLPPELKDVPKTDLLCYDARPAWLPFMRGERVPDAASEAGQTIWWKIGKASVSTNVHGWVSSQGTKACGTWIRPGKGDYAWTKVWTGRLGRNPQIGIDNFFTWRPSDIYVECDGMAEDPNWYEVWISSKLVGENAETKDRNHGLFIDRLILRHVKAPK